MRYGSSSALSVPGGPEHLAQSRAGIVVAEAGPAEATTPTFEVRFNIDPGTTVDSRDAFCEPNQTRTDAAAAVFGIDLQDTDDRLGQMPVGAPEQS